MTSTSVCIAVEHIDRDRFVYQQLSFAKAEVYVSSIACTKQLASIFVGYSFGSFSMYNMFEMKMVYSSSCSQRLLSPINNFIYMEPDNDPKCFIYLWVVRGKSACSEQEK